MSNLLDDYSNLGEKPPRPLGAFTVILYLFAGTTLQGSFLLAIVTSIIFWVYGIHTEIIHTPFTNKTWIETTGIIKKIEPSGFYLNQGKIIYKYEFTYEIDERILESVSHSSRFEKWNEGEIVPIFYDASNNRAIIEGMHTEIYEYLVGVIIVILPTILTLYLFLWGLRKNILFLRLLKNGVFIIAQTSCKEVPKSKFNIATYDFNFKIEGIQYKADFVGVKNEEADSGKILYLPNDPKTHIPLGKLVDSKVMDNFGQIEKVGSSVLFVLILPIIAILINVLGWYLQ